MPALVSLPILDANGDGILDGTGINIQEAEMDIALLAGVIPALFVPGLGEAELLGIFGDALINILQNHAGGGVGLNDAQAAQLTDIADIIQTWKAPYGTDHAKLEVMRGQLDDIHAAYPPSWPTTAPDWYTSPPDLSGVGSSVWGYSEEGYPSVLKMIELLHLWRFHSLYEYGVPLAEAPGFMVQLPNDLTILVTSPLFAPKPDYQDILDTDTRLSWLQRTDTMNTWSLPVGDSNPSAPTLINGEVTQGWLRPTFTEADFQGWKLSGLTSGQVAAVKGDTEAILAEFPITIPPPTVTLNAPPVWPGEANVTYDDAVALADQLVLDGPMDGCVVNVTTPPTRTGLRMIGGQPMDYGVGEMSFGNDSGWIEPWVYLGFRTAVFTPKTMRSASHAYFRVLAGAGGTVQAWHRTPT